MIIWIASYPRSGNTLTTQILGKVFQQRCFEKYNNFDQYIKPDEQGGGHQELGLSRYDGTWEEFYQKSRDAKETVLIKTHDGPEDDSPCIYVVRDGLQSLESYHAYYHKITKASCTWEDLIMGTIFPYLSWGGHLDAWDILHRPRTLLLRYEWLVEEKLRFLDDVTAFSGLEQKAPWENKFLEHQKRDPGFFRCGISNRSATLPDGIKELFEFVHGDWMKCLQYSENEAPSMTRKHLRQWLTGKAAEIHQLEKMNYEFHLELKKKSDQLESTNSKSPSGLIPFLKKLGL